LREDPSDNDGFNVVGTLSLENLQLHENRPNVDNLLEKRHSADIFPVEILPYLYLGNADTAADREVLDRYNIRYIINVTRDVENNFESDDHFHYLKIAVDDSCSNNLAQYFPKAINFIEEASRSGSAVLVHCLAGISRSVTVCLAYLMHAKRSTLDEAFDLVHKRNALIAPNFHFMGQLSEFERQLAGSKICVLAVTKFLHLPIFQSM
uniref:Dual specificity protein phosphatase n=1 Tax=Enterobius vermicularis TaxID=51028 RepID=A0A0N4VJQ6_ENTVE